MMASQRRRAGWLATASRWTARISGGLLIVLTLAMAVAYFIDGLRSDTGDPLSALAFFANLDFLFWGIGIAGLILAFRHEGLGGGVAFTAFVLRLLLNFFQAGMHVNEGMVNDFVPFAVPSSFYLLSWCIRRRGKVAR